MNEWTGKEAAFNQDCLNALLLSSTYQYSNAHLEPEQILVCRCI